jgi:hypothetical protein
MDYIQLFLSMVLLRGLFGSKCRSGSIRGGENLNQLSDHQLLKVSLVCGVSNKRMHTEYSVFS